MKEKKSKIKVQGFEIAVVNQSNNDYISLTDIAKHKDNAQTDDIIKNWLRNRNTIELLGFWEMIYNPNFNPSNSTGLENKLV